MKKSVLTLAVSILLTAAMLLGTPAALAAGGDAPEPAVDAEGTFDPSVKNSLTVGLEPEDYAKDLTAKTDTNPSAPGETQPDPAEPDKKTDELAAPLVVDLYLVATAEKLPGVNGYTYEFIDPFLELKNDFSDKIEGLTTEEEQATKAAAWLDMAQAAARTVFSLPSAAETLGEPKLGPAETVEELMVPEEGLVAGLYLIVPHGKGLTPEQYVEYAAGADEADAGSVVTKAYSELYAYSFTPYLVSLPGLNVTDSTGGTTGGNTADGGGWNYAVTTYLKVTQEPRYGKLEIVKGIDAYLGDWNASFVFEVKAYDGEGEDAKLVYSNVVGLDFNDGEREKSVELDRIPAGSIVTVTEVYSGASYTADATSSGPLHISATDVVTASFTNNHNDRNSGGYGANNHFSFEDGHWNWERDPDFPGGPVEAEG